VSGVFFLPGNDFKRFAAYFFRQGTTSNGLRRAFFAREQLQTVCGMLFSPGNNFKRFAAYFFRQGTTSNGLRRTFFAREQLQTARFIFQINLTHRKTVFYISSNY